MLALSRRKQEGQHKVNIKYISVRENGECAGGLKALLKKSRILFAVHMKI